ncbi:MAG: hypothetical protein QNJ27_02365 [Simkaniaceae bacterium]|nr:hypothetical protein [Simkaniaceae bacterium]
MLEKHALSDQAITTALIHYRHKRIAEDIAIYNSRELPLKTTGGKKSYACKFTKRESQQ